MRLLVVEDNVALADELCGRLKTEGYVCDWLVDGRDAMTRAADPGYVAAILDLGLPGRDGLDVIRAWRQQGIRLPVLILTARNSWSERIEGLQAGADDYLGKPFHPDELVLRLRSLIRRTHGVSSHSLLEVAGVVLDEARHCIKSEQGDVELSGSEFSLLRYLMLNPGRLLSKRQISDHLYSLEMEPSSNVTEVLISRLRHKLGRGVIETRRGQGYVFRGLAR